MTPWVPGRPGARPILDPSLGRLKEKKEEGDKPNSCEAPFGPFQQIGSNKLD